MAAHLGVRVERLLAERAAPAATSRRGTQIQETSDAVFARIVEAHAAFRSRGRGADVSALVARGTRTPAQWRGGLDKLANGEGGYRAAAVREEDLWRAVEDPTATEDARAGAAMLLRGSLDASGKARVRVAAEASASPRLRVLLEATTSASEEVLEEALADIEPPHARGMTR